MPFGKKAYFEMHEGLRQGCEGLGSFGASDLRSEGPKSRNARLTGRAGSEAHSSPAGAQKSKLMPGIGTY